MDYAALFAAGVAGLVIGGGIAWTSGKAVLQLRHDRIKQLMDQSDELWLALRHLRSNCFLTDTDGVRRRYDKVSRAVRERAEGN